ncbi:hypothetical protein LTR56_012145 [Elasticomyces elasticus]|nr:hypothetical protein LTR56_012145 [Elasticomyces elasticus]KAK3665758.1 hypothetical protein LTR22_003389 [Elasticomyces elasticus]KAK4926325.1 hypothetical protein LTR49_006797 [Elasticomyces elasticus]KAK5757303.1 hypothetical protein LTS12_012661 [Elasticomyces elasticus]
MDSVIEPRDAIDEQVVRGVRRAIKHTRTVAYYVKHLILLPMALAGCAATLCIMYVWICSVRFVSYLLLLTAALMKESLALGEEHAGSSPVVSEVVQVSGEDGANKHFFETLLNEASEDVEASEGAEAVDLHRESSENYVGLPDVEPMADWESVAGSDHQHLDVPLEQDFGEPNDAGSDHQALDNPWEQEFGEANNTQAHENPLDLESEHAEVLSETQHDSKTLQETTVFSPTSKVAENVTSHDTFISTAGRNRTSERPKRTLPKIKTQEEKHSEWLASMKPNDEEVTVSKPYVTTTPSAPVSRDVQEPVKLAPSHDEQMAIARSLQGEFSRPGTKTIPAYAQTHWSSRARHQGKPATLSGKPSAGAPRQRVPSAPSPSVPRTDGENVAPHLRAQRAARAKKCGGQGNSDTISAVKNTVEVSSVNIYSALDSESLGGSVPTTPQKTRNAAISPTRAVCDGNIAPEQEDAAMTNSPTVPTVHDHIIPASASKASTTAESTPRLARRAMSIELLKALQPQVLPSRSPFEENETNMSPTTAKLVGAPVVDGSASATTRTTEMPTTSISSSSERDAALRQAVDVLEVEAHRRRASLAETTVRKENSSTSGFHEDDPLVLDEPLRPRTKSELRPTAIPFYSPSAKISLGAPAQVYESVYRMPIDESYGSSMQPPGPLDYLFVPAIEVQAPVSNRTPSIMNGLPDVFSEAAFPVLPVTKAPPFALELQQAAEDMKTPSRDTHAGDQIAQGKPTLPKAPLGDASKSQAAVATALTESASQHEIDPTTQKSQVKEAGSLTKRQLKVQKDAARDGLSKAWWLREAARKKVQGTWSLEGQQALGTVTDAYNDQRDVLRQMMPGGELNEDDNAMYPKLQPGDLRMPKMRPPMIKEEDNKDAGQINEKDKVDVSVSQITGDAHAEGDGHRTDLLTKATTALERYNEAVSGFDRAPPQGRGNMITMSAALKARILRAKNYYMKRREAFETEFPGDGALVGLPLGGELREACSVDGMVCRCGRIH